LGRELLPVSQITSNPSDAPLSLLSTSHRVLDKILGLCKAYTYSDPLVLGILACSIRNAQLGDGGDVSQPRAGCTVRRHKLLFSFYRFGF
jgi:hypothetical protein